MAKKVAAGAAMRGSTAAARSAAAAALGSARSPQKAAAVRENGKLGGRPVNPNSARQRRLRAAGKSR